MRKDRAANLLFAILHWTWCLPQTLLGWIVISALSVGLWLEAKYRHGTAVVYETTALFGVSLGRYIVVPTGLRDRKRMISHEYGHCLQSLYFGPLYLIVVGLPSLTWNLLARVSPTIHSTYYKRWPESWADRLGGVSSSTE